MRKALRVKKIRPKGRGFKPRRNLFVKKGIATNALIALAAAIATMIFLLWYLLIQTSGITEAQQRDICKESVKKNAELHIKTYNPPSEMINCPPSYIEISNNKISYEYRSRTKSISIKGNEEQKKAELQRIMADEIYYCWNQFGEGKLDIFGGAKKYCSICSVISFKENTPEMNGFEFYSYLIKNTVPNTELSQQGVTYFDYMQGRSKKGEMDPNLLLKNSEGLRQIKFEQDSSYSVIFVYAKSEPMIDNAMEFIGKFIESPGGKGAIIGGALIAGGAILSMTGVALPAGVALIAAGAGAVIRGATFDAAVEGVIEANLKRNAIRDWTAFTIFGKYDENFIKGLGCEEIAGSST